MSALASSPDEARLLLRLLDLTSLNQGDTPDTVRELCRAAVTPFGAPAAVCVLPGLVEVAVESLRALALPQVRVATVANFPRGLPDPAAAAAETGAAVDRGAQEVDVVFPWRAFREGDGEVGADLVAACREACGDAALLKVILETGALEDLAAIRGAARIAAESGAHFLKTSTGKVPVGATPEAVTVLLEVIREREGEVGLKVSGGVRTVADGTAYLSQVREAMGPSWITPQRVRFGASSLLGDILRHLA